MQISSKLFNQQQLKQFSSTKKVSDLFLASLFAFSLLILGSCIISVISMYLRGSLSNIPIPPKINAITKISKCTIIERIKNMFFGNFVFKLFASFSGKSVTNLNVLLV